MKRKWKKSVTRKAARMKHIEDLKNDLRKNHKRQYTNSTKRRRHVMQCTDGTDNTPMNRMAEQVLQQQQPLPP